MKIGLIIVCSIVAVLSAFSSIIEKLPEKEKLPGWLNGFLDRHGWLSNYKATEERALVAAIIHSITMVLAILTGVLAVFVSNNEISESAKAAENASKANQVIISNLQCQVSLAQDALCYLQRHATRLGSNYFSVMVRCEISSSNQNAEAGDVYGPVSPEFEVVLYSRQMHRGGESHFFGNSYEDVGMKIKLRAGKWPAGPLNGKLCYWEYRCGPSEFGEVQRSWMSSVVDLSGVWMQIQRVDRNIRVGVELHPISCEFSFDDLAFAVPLKPEVAHELVPRSPNDLIFLEIPVSTNWNVFWGQLPDLREMLSISKH